jgi:hypothetical protein
MRGIAGILHPEPEARIDPGGLLTMAGAVRRGLRRFEGGPP